LQVQEEKITFKIEQAMLAFIDDVGKRSSAPVLQDPPFSQQKPFRALMNHSKLRPFSPSKISQTYSAEEIYSKLRSRFDEQGLKQIYFEYAITSESFNYEVELHSRNFENSYHDSASLKPIILPITVSDDPLVQPYEHVWIILPHFKKQLYNSLIWIMLASAVFTAIVIAAFYVTVKTLINQKKLSEIKSDFINNMTHELKTPLATISLAVEMLRSQKVQASPERLQQYTNTIKEENVRMNKHVETILQAGLMERQDMKFNIQPVQVNAVIEDVAHNFALQLEEKQGRLELQLHAADDTIQADATHFSNLVNNLIDNAVKYSRENPLIRVSTTSSPKSVCIRVEDNGIGMSKETVKRIFEKFYRAHTGNVHNVKGFGLGMSYVKNMVDTFKGKIKVDSTPGKGSTFNLEFPLVKK
jgi:two-component system phosphate regulon sensor histidine kinase PhoR